MEQNGWDCDVEDGSSFSYLGGGYYGFPKKGDVPDYVTICRRDGLTVNKGFETLDYIRDMRGEGYSYVGYVEPFPNRELSKENILKPLEEAAEIRGELQEWERATAPDEKARRWQNALDECADTIQATVNLLSAMGVTDLREIMERCHRRNEDRGRYGRA